MQQLDGIIVYNWDWERCMYNKCFRDEWTGRDHMKKVFSLYENSRFKLIDNIYSVSVWCAVQSQGKYDTIFSFLKILL